MFVYLNKKIAVPNCTLIRSVAWSWEHDYIACGGDNGTLKVIKIQTMWNQPQSSKTFSNNQTLESHKSHVKRVCWNEPFQKLTSSDDSGSIIVWMLYKGMWYEEMVNNRNKSLVSGMAWTRDGQKICIVYDDGAIITGSVEGSRIWGKDIKNVTFTRVEWSPDGKIILIGTKNFEVHIYDFSGNFVRKIHISRGQHDDNANLVSLKWSNFTPLDTNDSSRRLLFAFNDGIVHLFKDDKDDYPLNVETDLQLTSAEWNSIGNIFAVTGRSVTTTIVGNKEDGSSSSNYLKLYNANGDLLQIIRIPGVELSGCSWDRNSLRIALAVDSYLLLAQIHASHQWAFLEHSIVIVLPDHYNATPEYGTRLIFWEIDSNQKYEQQILHYCQMTFCKNMCAVVSKIYPTKRTISQEDGISTKELLLSTTSTNNSTSTAPMYCLSLFNSYGSLIDLHTVDMIVRHCALNTTRLIVTSDDSIYIWHFADSLPNRSEFGARTKNEKLLNELTLDDTSLERTLFSESPSAPVRLLERSSVMLGIKLISKNDPISCITASEKCFLLAHDSGIINQYGLPNAVLMHRIEPINSSVGDVSSRSIVGNDIRALLFNQNCSRFAMIHKTGKLFCYDFEANNEETDREGKWLFIKKTQDVMDAKWSTDNADYLAIHEKNRVFILDVSKANSDQNIVSSFSTTTPDISPSNEELSGEMIRTNGYVASLDRFVLKCVNLDFLIIDTVNSTVEKCSSYIEQFDVGPVKQLKNLLEHESTDVAVKYVKQFHSNQFSVWNVLIEHCLLTDQLDIAQEALVKCRDYRGIQFLKSLRKVTDVSLRKAEVCNYFEHYNDADKLYRDANRPDLLLSMYESKGKYEKVLEILDDYSFTDHEKLSTKCHMNIGDKFSNSYKWNSAMIHYEKIAAVNKLVPCYIHTGNYNTLINLIDTIDDNNLLCDIAHYLKSIGIIRDSVRAFIKANRIEQAVKVCEIMSEWKMAIDLARKYQISDVNMILDKYVEHLLSKNKFVEIVEVYRKANRISDAMSIVLKLIAELHNTNHGDAILFKKLFVLIGLLYEESKQNKNDETKTIRAKATLNELLETDDILSTAPNNHESSSSSSSSTNRNNNKIVHDPWKGAEAYHFLLLTQKHLYNSDYESALKSSMRLINYDEFLSTEEIYCLLALSSYHSKNYSLCSKAFIKLESLTSNASQTNRKRSDLAIFSLDDLKLSNLNKNNHNIKRLETKNNYEVYETMAFEIFEKHSPSEIRNKDKITMINCKFCMKTIPDYSIECQHCNTKFMPCIETGKSIMDPMLQWTCAKCNHHAIKDNVKNKNSCPLCHFRIRNY